MCGSTFMNACLHGAHYISTSTVLLQYTDADDLLANCPGLGEEEH